MSQKKAYPTSLAIRLLVHLLFTSFTRYYKVKKQLPDEVKNLKSPYLVLANHVGFWDPFVAGYFLPYFTHFVSSDAVFRNPLLRFFLTRLGTIPKKKNMRDSQVIRDIIAVINQGENVGIFPEAVRNWSGSTSPMDASIGKLIKMLKVPVVVPILKGMNILNPRWAYALRSYPMIIEYKLAFTAEQVKELSADELFDGLTNAMHHDDVEFQKSRMIKIKSKKRAEHIGHTLYLCPECNAIDSFRAQGNDFHCSTCNYEIHVDEYGFYSRKGEGKLHFENARDWFLWEEKEFVNYVRAKYQNNFQEAFYTDIDMNVFKNDASGKLKAIGLADVSLYRDKIKIDFKKKEALIFNFNDLQTINPQTKERLEVFYNNDAYRITGTRPGVSALKWEVAVNTIWNEMGLTAKMAPYIRV
ncbi:MAG: 1-acyl-sn-glycerol-3-phosphate acyltransferase [Bacteroidales bacterium]|nr:1-acyl-sn-glycerol-3-phosphate acyltransferase [Bacteroidales bacterium]